MAPAMIPDIDLLAEADVVTIWVAGAGAPTDVWSLADAIAWVKGRDEGARIRLFRPPGQGIRAVWIESEQIQRLAAALGLDATSGAA